MDSDEPSSPDAVWNPPAGFAESPTGIFPSASQDTTAAPSQIQNQPAPPTNPVGTIDRTVYQNCGHDDARVSGAEIPCPPVRKDPVQVPKTGTVYQNWDSVKQNQEPKGPTMVSTPVPGGESAPPPIPERSYRAKQAPPLPPKGIQSLDPTTNYSANLGSDFDESATRPHVSASVSNLHSRNTGTEENNMSSLPPTMGYPNPPYAPLECPNPYMPYFGQMRPNFPFPGPEAWKDGTHSMQQMAQLLQYQQQIQNQMRNPYNPTQQATKTPQKEKENVVNPNQGQKGSDVKGQGKVDSNTKPEPKPPKKKKVKGIIIC